MSKRASIEKFEILVWDGYVYLKPMTVGERLKFQVKHYKREEGESPATEEEIMYDMLRLSLVSSVGDRLFTKENIGSIGEKDWNVVSKLFTKCTELNIISTEAEEAAKKK